MGGWVGGWDGGGEGFCVGRGGALIPSTECLA